MHTQERGAGPAYVAAATQIFGAVEIEHLRDVFFHPRLGVIAVVDEVPPRMVGEDYYDTALLDDLEAVRRDDGAIITLRLDPPAARPAWLRFCDDVRLYPYDERSTWFTQTLLRTVGAVCTMEMGTLPDATIGSISFWCDDEARGQAELLAITRQALERWPQARWSVDAGNHSAIIATALQQRVPGREQHDTWETLPLPLR